MKSYRDNRLITARGKKVNSEKKKSVNFLFIYLFYLFCGEN